jgi:hypothetical protein
MIPVARPAYMGKKGRPSGRPLFMSEKLTAHIANPPARGGFPGKGLKAFVPAGGGSREKAKTPRGGRAE